MNDASGLSDTQGLENGMHSFYYSSVPGKYLIFVCVYVISPNESIGMSSISLCELM